LAKQGFLKSALAGVGLLRKANAPDFPGIDDPDPENQGTALFRRGRYRMRAGEVENAVKDFDRAIELLPDYAEARVSRAECLDMLGRAEAAQPDYVEARRLWAAERTGAPVVAFCRMDDKPIRVREPIAEPDAVIVLDPTLVHQVDLFSGLDESGYLLVNTSRALVELGLDEYVQRFQPGRCATVPATEIARERLGRPLPNAALLGAFAALTREISLDSVAAAIRERFAGVTGEQNVAAAEDAHAFLVVPTAEASRA